MGPKRAQETCHAETRHVDLCELAEVLHHVICEWPALTRHNVVENLDMTDNIMLLPETSVSFGTYDNDGSTKEGFLKTRGLSLAKSIVTQFRQSIAPPELPFASAKWELEKCFNLLQVRPDVDVNSLRVKIHPDYWTGAEEMVIVDLTMRLHATNIVSTEGLHSFLLTMKRLL